MLGVEAQQNLKLFLQDRLDDFDGAFELEKFATGQSNPTYLVRTASKSYVLRKQPDGPLLKSAHAVDREFRVQSALANSPVPVATMLLLCENKSILGTLFYLMDYVPGQSYMDPLAPNLTNEQRTKVYDEINRVLASLHDQNLDTIGLQDFGASGNYFERQIDRWSRQYEASETGTLPAMDALIEALKSRPAFDDGQQSLVHGDYRIDNMIFDAETFDMRALLDWELSTTGHPYSDLASLLMQWRMPKGTEGRGLAGVDRAKFGIPTEEEFVALYCERRGLDPIEDMGYFLAFAFFRMAAVLQGVKKRALDGNASNPEKAAKLGSYVPLFAEQGLAAIKERT